MAIAESLSTKALSTETLDGPEGTPIDQVQLAEVTERLRHLLSDMDPEATYWLQRHQALLANGYRQAFPAIAEAITAFEFDLAIDRLDAALSARALLVREILTIDTANC
jgi:hypothetical protein